MDGGVAHNEVLLVSTTSHLDAPFLAGMARVRAARGQVQTDEESGLRWFLDTRYYTANLRLVQVSHTGGAEASHVDASVRDKLPRGTCDAFLLLCDASEAGTGAKLQPWAALLEELAPSVQLCVAACTASGGESARNDIEEWCVENAVEFIPWNPLDDESSGEATGGLLSETQGLFRVMEALEANMWPAMTMKPRTGIPRPAIPPEPAEEEAEGTTDGTGTRHEAEQALADVATVEPSVEGKPEKGEEQKEEPTLLESKTKGERKEQDDDEDVEWTEERDADFEKTFQQLMGLRDMRAKAAQMSDRDRRAFAADAALALARAFGLDLDDSDSD